MLKSPKAMRTKMRRRNPKAMKVPTTLRRRALPPLLLGPNALALPQRRTISKRSRPMVMTRSRLGHKVDFGRDE